MTDEEDDKTQTGETPPPADPADRAADRADDRAAEGEERLHLAVPGPGPGPGPRPEPEPDEAAGAAVAGAAAPLHADRRAAGRRGRSMTSFTYVLDGARRVWRAPTLLASIWLVNLLLAVPFALAVRGALQQHFGVSLVAGDAAQGFSLDWWGELNARAEGLIATFTASVIGFAAVLRNASDLADGRAPIAPLAGAIALWLLAWTFLWGGILDRLARDRPTRAAGFFAACGAHAGRMLRLGLMAGVAYVILWRYVHPLLFGSLYGWITRDLAVERTAFVTRLLLYVLFGALFLGVRLLTDLARVRAVVEDRRSMIGAYLAAWRLLRARPGAILAIYAGVAAAFVVWLGLYALVAPGARGAGLAVWFALVTGQLYLAGRLWLKLLVPAALIALYRAEVARGDLDLTPPPVWPESPAALP